jgi:hypothetical protein
LGTSTPTSITVVLTSTPICPLVNSDITAFFSAGGMRECSRPTITPGKAAAQFLMGLGRVAQVQRLALLDQRADPVDLPPCATWARMRSITSSRRLVGDDLGHDRACARAAARRCVDTSRSA